MSRESKTQVIGGARGIGLFTENGAYIIVADILEKEGIHMADPIGGCYVHCDVSKEADVEAAVELAMRRRGDWTLCLLKKKKNVKSSFSIHG